MRVFLLPIVVIFISVACKQSTPELSETNRNSGKSGSLLSYATGFTLHETGTYAYLTVFNPWNKDTLSTYLVLKKHNHTDSLPKATFTIQLPVKRIAVLSSSAIGMLKELNSDYLISAASDAEYIYDSVLYQRFINGSLKNLGKTTSLNTEIIVNHDPDLIFRYIYGGEEMADARLKDADIPVAYHLEFMESHPLGRAEWIKFFATFTNQAFLADSIFTQIEETYTHYAALVRNIKQKPTVLDGSSYKGVWYAAGGKSFPARLYADAGADYYWKDNDQSGSLSLSLESIIENQANADYWIGSSSGSRNELLSIESRYELLKAFKRNNVFFYGKRINPNGGLGYYESGVVRPDILLMDLLWIFHPQVLENKYEPVYIQRIK